MKLLNCEKMRMMLVGFLAAIVVGGGNVKADFTWTEKSSMPTPRWNFATCVVNGKIYALGGEKSEGDWGGVLSSVEEYDPISDTWTRKADMPVQMADFDACVADGKIYAIGGDDSGSRVYMYDPITDTWTRKADMPTPRWFLATCVVGGRIYAIGGTTPFEQLLGLKTVEEYDPATDTWTKKADMPLVGLWGLRGNVVNGKICVFGGRQSKAALPLTYEYDPATNIWTQKTNLPVATSQMGSVVLGDKIIVIGGWFFSGEYPYTTIQIYDPEKDIWTIEADTPFLRACFSAEVVRGRIFAIGGTDRPHPCPAISTVYECDTGFIPALYDFNGDDKFDKADMHIMVDHWGEDYHLCDIDPLPFGDGIVDIKDMTVLAEHLYGLTAHWKLDETEGDIAYDSYGNHDGTLNGNPFWLPTGGIKGGSLMLDGIDDYIETPLILDPSKGPFSVFAWVYCWMPGQVIISQIDGNGVGETWLGMDAISGNLMTGLVPQKIGWVTPQPLVSESIITDIQWHHVGLVWDGSYRTLYVDGIEVAKDKNAQNSLKSADGGLYIGASKDLAAGTFFSGMIDDVRIYNQILTAEEIRILVQ